MARASFQELLEDYEDYLRQRGTRQWDKNSSEALEVRGFCRTNRTYGSNTTDGTDNPYWSYLVYSERAANAMVCLINQANFLLDKQIQATEKDFVERGGYAENLRRQREEEKKRQVARFMGIQYRK